MIKQVLKYLKVMGKCMLLFVIPGLAIAQDMHFSQYGEAPLMLNPALSAVAYDIRVVANYRNQWASVASPFRTFGFSGELGLKYRKREKAYVSTGLAVYSDKSGDGQLGTTHVNVSVGGVVKVGAYSKVSGAFAGGLTSRTVNPSVFQWENQYDGYQYVAGAPSGELYQPGNFSYADFSAGVNWHYSKSEQYISASNGVRFDAGLSAWHVNMPKNSYIFVNGEKQIMRYSMYGQASIGQKAYNFCYMPGLLCSVQGSSVEFIPTFMMKFIFQDQSVHTTNLKPCALSAGAQYRVKDAFVPMLLFEYDMYALGVSYDLNLSKLSPVSKMKGGLEIALRFNWNPGYGKMLGGSYNRPTYKL